MGLAVAPSRTPEVVLICCDVRISADKKMENSNLDDIDNSDSNSEVGNGQRRHGKVVNSARS